MKTFTDVLRIGSGGFGEVWRCERQGDREQFAKKVLEAGADADAVERFRREVRILSSLDHPNVVRVIAKHLDEPPYWYVMPLYDASLDAELDEVIGNETRVVPIFTAILDAVGYAHGEGVIHRDLKPANVLLNGDGDLVVSDFGLGRIVDSASTRQTVTGFVMGTVLYMAPEQMLDAKHVDERADIYSLGRMLYELYTERLTLAPQDTSRLNPGVALIINRCTERLPEKRYQTVAELKQAWLSVIDRSHNETELDELLLLRAALSTSAGAATGDVRRLITLLAKHRQGDDFIHETVMQLHPDAIVLMYHENPVFTRQLVEQFVSVTGSASWGFTYTDKIGNVCQALYEAIDDAQVRAALLECLARVGFGHNRWHVIGIFQRLLEGPKRDGEGFVIAERLRQHVSKYILLEAAGRLSLHKLDPAIRQVLPSTEQ